MKILLIVRFVSNVKIKQKQRASFENMAPVFKSKYKLTTFEISVICKRPSVSSLSFVLFVCFVFSFSLLISNSICSLYSPAFIMKWSMPSPLRGFAKSWLNLLVDASAIVMFKQTVRVPELTGWMSNYGLLITSVTYSCNIIVHLAQTTKKKARALMSEY